MGIISGSGSFRGRFGDHFRVGDHFGVGIISGAVHIAKTSKSKSREDALYKGIADLEREIDEADGTKGESQIPQLNTKLDNLNCELEKIIEYRTKGAIMRSRIRWHNEGEKNTKYFLSLEKRQGNNQSLEEK